MALNAKDFIALNDGIVRIYSVDNDSEEGNRPIEAPKEKYTLHYKEHTVGLQRFYTALQAAVRISRAVIVPLLRDINPQDIAVIDDTQYRIEQVQQRSDTKPPTLLLSLSDITEVYEL